MITYELPNVAHFEVRTVFDRIGPVYHKFEEKGPSLFILSYFSEIVSFWNKMKRFIVNFQRKRFTTPKKLRIAICS